MPRTWADNAKASFNPVTAVRDPCSEVFVCEGADDGNRTHVRSLASFYSSIELGLLWNHLTNRHVLSNRFPEAFGLGGEFPRGIQEAGESTSRLSRRAGPPDRRFIRYPYVRKSARLRCPKFLAEPRRPFSKDPATRSNVGRRQ